MTISTGFWAIVMSVTMYESGSGPLSYVTVKLKCLSPNLIYRSNTIPCTIYRIYLINVHCCKWVIIASKPGGVRPYLAMSYP